MKNQFSQQLGKLRRQANLSQEQLAQQVFVTRQSVSKWEQGETTPDLDTLIKLANLLQVDLNELITGTTATNLSQSADQHSTSEQLQTERPMNVWEFLAGYWWAIIALAAVIGIFFH